MAGGRTSFDPTAGEIKRVLAEQNPWHFDGKVPQELAKVRERPLAQGLWRRLLADEPRRFQIVLGPRRVGKTTVMYQTVRALLGQGVPANRLWWLRLDHPILLQSSMEDLVRHILRETSASSSAPVFLFFDELTYGRDWDLWLKTFYDEHWPVKVAGTSSSVAALRERHVESGVGRWEEQYLAPYLFDEFLDLVDRAPKIEVGNTLAETLLRLAASPVHEAELVPLRVAFSLIGGFPELLLSKDVPLEGDGEDNQARLLRSQRVLRSDAVERAIYKDIPQAFGVNDPLLLERMLYMLAGQFTRLLSPSALSKNLGLSQPTFDRYLSYLERAFIVFALPNYSGNENVTQRRGRKLYFVDGAVRNAALQRGTAPLTSPEEMGLLIENMAASHLFALSQQSQVRVYHWREGSNEVDLLYDDPGGPLAFEIGTSSSHPRQGMRAFLRKHPRFAGGAWYIAPGLPSRAPGNDETPWGTLPLELFLLAVGRQAAAYLEQRLM